ncbi:hypothetical protein ABL78_6844 [Leptomonas seymouri]|uniref:Uncharacterized protein n=1 Tax=Leptomonas seymouri TaxID=5684 RepID=A0A0N0P3V9_LEPSE|nr:hypothetical protein ABL78_6844 [Leptomonas seymouri]|eukprot:KPI84107.1 hypothetical protein ABL78_6844 [Leptomonas seymouri]
MPIKRFRGVHYKQLLQRLPRNLLVFDGHCLMCQARVRYVLERNFSFFSFTKYLSSNVEREMVEGLDRHCIHFASLDSPEGVDIHRSFFQRSVKVKKSSGASAATPSTPLSVLPVPADLVMVFVEKVPSQTASFLARARRTELASDDLALFQNSSSSSSSKLDSRSGSSAKSSNGSGPASTRLREPNDTDLLISTNYAAMCRVGMHLDRFLVRSAFCALYYAVPSSVGDWWFERYVCQRRKRLWGTSEEDAVRVDGLLEGMRERRWTWRSSSARR